MAGRQLQFSPVADPIAEPFIVAKAGTPLAKVVALDVPVGGQSRTLGLLEGQIQVPDHFDRMGCAEIEELFGGHR